MCEKNKMLRLFCEYFGIKVFSEKPLRPFLAGNLSF